MRPLAMLFLCIALAGCFWRGYARVVEIHLDVLQSMAAKMCGLTAGPPPVSESMGEFSYPARRARELERRFGGRGELGSYRGFTALTSRYEDLVERFDKARNSRESWQAASEGICTESRAIAAAAADVRRALATER